MRFRLVEDDASPKEEDYIKKVESAKTQKEKDDALKDLLGFWETKYRGISKLSDDSFRGIRSIILSSIQKNGLDEANNKFLQYVVENYREIEPKHEINLSILRGLMDYGLVRYKESDLEKPNCEWLGDVDLLDRNRDDFEYTVKIFNIANDKVITKSYFKNFENITVDDLYENSNYNGRIKDAGLRSRGGDNTIYQQVEDWAQRYGEVERKEDSEEATFSINQLFRNKGIKKKEEKIKELSKILQSELDSGSSSLTADEVNKVLRYIENATGKDEEEVRRVFSIKFDIFKDGEFSKLFKKELAPLFK